MQFRQGLVTATARTKQYALPMSSIAQHVFLLAKGAGFGTHDDCATIRVYLTGREHVLPHHRGKQQHVPHDEVQIGSRITIETIKSLLTGIHLATALEVFSFLEVLGLDQGIFYSFVLGAAGASTIFRKIGSQVRQKSKISLRTLHDADKVVHDLVSILCYINEIREGILTTSSGISNRECIWSNIFSAARCNGDELLIR